MPFHPVGCRINDFYRAAALGHPPFSRGHASENDFQKRSTTPQHPRFLRRSWRRAAGDASASVAEPGATQSSRQATIALNILCQLLSHIALHPYRQRLGVHGRLPATSSSNINHSANGGGLRHDMEVFCRREYNWEYNPSFTAIIKYSWQYEKF